MKELLQKLIEALRHELQQYGEMLALLDQQQEQVMARAADDMLQTVATVNRHAAVIQAARLHREQCRHDLCRMLALREDASLATLLSNLPNDYRPLVQALVEENNALLVRVQQRARQNHLLLSRSLELMQRFMSTLFPGTRPTVYGGSGGLLSPSHGGQPLYDAVG